MSTADFFDVVPPASSPLRDDLLRMIRDRDYATPRHRQVALGPSDVSHPCMRRIAMSLMQEPQCNPDFDPLASIYGTALHVWLASAAEHANAQLGRQRYLVETRVEVAPGLSGSSDLYDTDTNTVIDWKTASPTRLRRYKKDPGPAYKGQVYLYGKGFVNAGYPVERVAIAFIPRGATLHSVHVWDAPYDPKIADWVLQRRNTAIGLMCDLDVEHHPERYGWIPATPYDCDYCDFHAKNPSGPTQCGGAGA